MATAKFAVTVGGEFCGEFPGKTAKHAFAAYRRHIGLPTTVGADGLLQGTQDVETIEAKFAKATIVRAAK